MKIRFGGTRIVLVTEDRAYKIARFCFLKVVIKIIRTLLAKQEFDRLYEIHKDGKAKLIVKSVLSGLIANRAEYRFWQKNQTDEFAPVIGSWLFGLVIAQPRARRVTMEEIQKSPLGHWLVDDIELSRSDQYGWIGGQVVLVDYAHFGFRW